MKTDLSRHSIDEAQAFIDIRPDLQVRVPWPRPEGPFDEAFRYIMKFYAVPILEPKQRRDACIIYWPPLKDPNAINPLPEEGLAGTTVRVEGRNRPVLRAVWEFFMGKRVLRRSFDEPPWRLVQRVIQLCADRTPEGAPGKNLCININHLAIIPNRSKTIPTPLPQEARYRRLVLRDPSPLIALDLGCSIRDVALWCDELSAEDKAAYREKRFDFLERFREDFYKPPSQKALHEAEELRDRYAFAKTPAVYTQLNLQTSIPDPTRYLPEEWSNPRLEQGRVAYSSLRRAKKKSSSLLIGLPSSRRDP